MLKTFLLAGGEWNENFRYPLRGLLVVLLDEALLDIGYMEKDAADQHMIKNSFTYKAICQKAEDQYRKLYEDQKQWPSSKHLAIPRHLQQVCLVIILLNQSYWLWHNHPLQKYRCFAQWPYQRNLPQVWKDWPLAQGFSSRWSAWWTRKQWWTCKWSVVAAHPPPLVGKNEFHLDLVLLA